MNESKMPKIIKLKLSEEQSGELDQIARTHKIPYMRERAAALLKVASGIPAEVVACERLLVKRDPDSVRAWIQAYKDHGVEGLAIKPGRGRKPAFPP